MSTLADAIIEVGPFAAGEEMGGLGMALHQATDLNELRDELIRLRAIAAKASRFTVEAWARDDASLYLSCNRCDWETRVGDGSAGLPDLNQRAAEHAEVCR